MTTTEKASHTPRPWESHFAWDVTGYPCFFIHGMAGEAKRNIPVLEADARLIAASPEMLEALEAILPILKLERCLTDPAERQTAWDEPIAVIESAIRKAKEGL